jgi:nucleoside-diphosphate-sugar epimerase
MILVTGSTGHLGANLVRRLSSDGHKLRVIIQPGSDTSAISGISLQHVSADLRDPTAIAAAVAGCDQIYHCAADVSTRNSRQREIYESNVVGTRNLLSAARQAGVCRVVVTSSLSAIGKVPGQPSSEDDPFDPFDKHTPYAHTKAAAEHECLKAVADGLDVVIVTSTAIVGPNDFTPSRLGGVMLKFANGKLPAFPAGGFAFVAADDLVNGHLLAMASGRRGQKYLISTEFLTTNQFLQICAEATGVRHRPVRIPSHIAASAAAIWDPLARRLFPGRPEQFTPAAIEFLRLRRRADCTKAVQELGYQPTGITQAISKAYECFARRGLLKGHTPGSVPAISHA